MSFSTNSKPKDMKSKTARADAQEMEYGPVEPEQTQLQLKLPQSGKDSTRACELYIPSRGQ
jgi:hypothetical protein